jgi:hypothetical protein
MLATLAGVIIAVVLGIASLAVNAYQAWLQYQSWKHPVLPRDFNSRKIEHYTP